MIAALGGRSIEQARTLARRFIEQSGKRRKNAADAARDRERLSAMRGSTRKARRAIEEMFEQMVDRVFGHVHAREDGTSPHDRRVIEKRLLDGIGQITEDALLEAIMPAVTDAADAGALFTPSIAAGFDVKPQRAIDALYRMELQFSRQFAARERSALKAIMLDALDKGSSVPDVVATIRANFADSVTYVDREGSVSRTMSLEDWAEMVARTEISRAANLGHLDTMQRAGVAQHTWSCTEDDRCCDDCDDLDGETAKLGEAFGDSECVAPPLHPSCRCTTIADFSDLDDPAGEEG